MAETSGDQPVRFGVVGGGWRAGYFLKLARQVPGEVACTGVVARRPEVRAELAERWVLPTFATVDELVAADRPEFVITSVTKQANPEIIEALVAHSVPVLSETPPATDMADLRRLWEQVGSSDLVQVAEQYMLMPTHAARLTAVERGLIGELSSVQISSTQLYHAVSVIRNFLGIGFESATVSARRFTGPLINPANRRGWTGDLTPKQATTTIATIEFVNGRSAVYDFTDNQTRNHLRSRRLLLRGSSGEISNDSLVRLGDEQTILTSRIVRRQTGHELDHEGFDTAHLSVDGEVLWRNPFFGLRMNDEDIAMMTIMLRMAAWARGNGPAPYPLAHASQDHLIGLALERSADERSFITTGEEPWAS